MTKRRDRGNANKVTHAKVRQPGRKSLPLLKFEEFARTTLQELAATLPSGFTPDDLAQVIHTYLDYSLNKIQLRHNFKVRAMDVERYYDPQKYPTLLDQADFKQWAEPLLADDNLRMVGPSMQVLRKRAGALGLDWSAAVPIIRRETDRLRPDQRPEAVQRGEFAEQVIDELRRIRQGRSGFRTFEDLERIYPSYDVVRILRKPPFDSDDRDLLASPQRWEKVVTYATGILTRYFDKSAHTIIRDRKQFKASIRRTPRQN